MAMTFPRLYRRCVRWGFTTGAAAGGATGALLGFVAGDNLGDGTLGARVGLALAFQVYAIPIGVIVAVIPTLLGGFLVADAVQRRHPEPASQEAVERDLTLMFTAIVAVLDVGVLVAIFAGGKGFESVVDSLPYMATATACAALILWRARGSIGRAWAEG